MCILRKMISGFFVMKWKEASPPSGFQPTGSFTHQTNELDDKIHAARWKRGGGNIMMIVSDSAYWNDWSNCPRLAFSQRGGLGLNLIYWRLYTAARWKRGGGNSMMIVSGSFYWNDWCCCPRLAFSQRGVELISICFAKFILPLRHEDTKDLLRKY